MPNMEAKNPLGVCSILRKNTALWSEGKRTRLWCPLALDRVEMTCYNGLFVVIMAFGGKEINGYRFIDNLIDHAMLLVKPS